MELELTRQTFKPDCVTGVLRVSRDKEELYQCYTLEDKKVDTSKSNNCIPAGKYKVVLTYSPKFKRLLPLVLVEGRDGIRIHSGNTDQDTTGCILVGEAIKGNYLGGSRVALAWLMHYLNQAVDNQEDICLTIKEEPERSQDGR